MDAETESTLREIYAETRTIAVVGASGDPRKPAHEIPRYLQSQGYRVVPVNPQGGELLGEPVRPSLREVDAPIDVVDVFRPPAEAEAIAREAVEAGARVLWFQPGTASDEAVALAQRAGLLVVSDACMGTIHGHLGLGPGPWT